MINPKPLTRVNFSGREFEFSYHNSLCSFNSFEIFNEVNEMNGFILEDTLVVEVGFFCYQVRV